MNLDRSTAYFCAALAAAGAGCRDEKEPGIAVDEAPLLIARTVCPKAWACCMPAQMANNELAAHDEPSCEMETEKGFRNLLDVVKVSQGQGRARYRGDLLESCLDVIRTSSCAALNTTNHFTGVLNCDRLIEPKVEAGGACTFDYECADGFCDKPNEQSDGVCRARPIQGESCADQTCKQGFGCDPQQMTCDELRGLDDACTGSWQCASGNCTAAGGMAGVCARATADKCFYASSCSAVFATRADFAVFALLGLIAGARCLRRRARDRRDAHAREGTRRAGVDLR